MSDDQNSCLVTKLQHYIDLNEGDLDRIASLEEEEKDFGRHETVYSIGEPMTRLFVVKSGWLYNYVDLADGRRQLVRLAVPGDIVGLPDIAFKDATSTLRTCEDAVLCPFPKQKMDAIFTKSPRLTALLFTLANRDGVSLIDLLQALGRMSARERISYFLLDIAARLKVTNPAMENQLRMPLNQSEIGDLLGLTSQYVSRTISQLESTGAISKASGMLTINQRDNLASSIDFADRHSQIDVSWFPSQSDA